MKGFWKMARNPSFVFRTCGQRIQIALSKSPENNQHRTTDPSNQRTNDPSNHRSIEPAIHRTSEPLNHQSIEPSNQRSIEPANHWTTDPSNHRTNDPSNQRSIELTNQRSVEPSNRSINRASDPLNHRTFKPESDVASDINVQNIACVASVSNRGIARKLERKQKRLKGEGEGRRGSFVLLPLPHHFFFALVPAF